jgi:predicted dithiol-disulfide oxidoreductase (DUF899 family)
MGWNIPWVSAAPGEFNYDLGFSQTEEASREAVAKVELPPRSWTGRTRGRRAERRRLGHRHRGYLTESPGFSAFAREGDDVFHTYSTTWRGLEFVMTYYPILDHAPMWPRRG